MPRYQTMSLGFPPFTKAVKWLIALNSGIFLLMLLLRATLPQAFLTGIAWFSLIPYQVTHGWLWQIVTYSFLHAGLFHLLFNMLALWMFGSQFESAWGRRQFLEFYFFCVVGAALVTVAIAYTHVLGVSTVTPTVGASGGIYGVLLAFGMIYAEREIFLFPLPFAIKAKYFVAILIFIALASAFQDAGGIANFAHLGGLFFGFIYVKYLPRRGAESLLSERYFAMRNAYYRWKRRRAARKFQVYMRKRDRNVFFDEHGNYREPEERDSKDDAGGSPPWVH